MRLPASALRHRLHHEGQSYRGIKDKIRSELADEWLLHSRRRVGDIATQLGFAEPSAFHRAFRKWRSNSPGAFRADRLAGGTVSFAALHKPGSR